MSQIKPEKFLVQVVTVDIDYRNKKVTISPEEAIIFDEEPSQSSSRPLEVRWVVRGLEKNDELFIRPKYGSSEKLFNPENEGAFKIPWPYNSITSGKPFVPKPGERLEWFYAVEVRREGKLLFGVDPCIIIQGGGLGGKHG